jgi:hypothetical protein
MLYHRSAAKAGKNKKSWEPLCVCVRERETERVRATEKDRGQIRKRQRYRPMCLYVYPSTVVRQRLSENVTAATNILYTQ